MMKPDRSRARREAFALVTVLRACVPPTSAPPAQQGRGHGRRPDFWLDRWWLRTAGRDQDRPPIASRTASRVRFESCHVRMNRPSSLRTSPNSPRRASPAAPWDLFVQPDLAERASARDR
jgi:hypothetical protein